MKLLIFDYFLNDLNQGCGSGSGLYPDSEDFVDPDPDPYWESGSGSRGKKIKKFQWKKCWIRIRIRKSIRIHNPDLNYLLKNYVICGCIPCFGSGSESINSSYGSGSCTKFRILTDPDPQHWRTL
jgi:hypothetical protein